MKTTRIGVTAALLALTAAGACERGVRLETRTFPIANLRPYQVEALIAPYVYSDRATDPGTLSTSEVAVTVRETADNLEKIARVLAEYDVAQPDVRLRFQLIEADDFTGADERIAAVEEELRKIFQFRGYRLAGEAVVSATDGSTFTQAISAADGIYALRGQVLRTQPGVIHVADVELSPLGGPTLVGTSVNVRPGQTLVLGSSPNVGMRKGAVTLLLTVTAEPSEP